MNILFYISGHGFGHATRMRAIIDAILERDPSIHIDIRTSAPQILFADLPSTQCTYHQISIDGGVIEKDIITQDPRATLKQYAEINKQRESIITNEIAFVKKNNANIIVSDIPPLASDIGQSADIPTVACSNFSWDFNYTPYTKQYPEYKYLITDIRSSYGKTDLLLRMPFHHPMDAFPRQQDIPLVARKPTIDPQIIRQQLNLSADDKRPIVLITFRIDSPIFQRALTELTSHNDLLILTYGSPATLKINNVISLKKEWGPNQYPNLVRASSLVVAKIGYSTLAECIAARTPLLYPPRENYPEYNLLREGAKKFLPSYLIPKDDFLEGRWYTHVIKMLQNTHTFSDMSSDGAIVAAKIICQQGN
ncbi:MAG: glycosyltransferase family protein [Patescibacteria group bacterium]|jgi:hypothetical protein